MHYAKLSAILGAVVLVSGCVTTLNPLYSDDVLVRDDNLEGSWVDKQDSRESLSITESLDGYTITGATTSGHAATHEKRFEAKLVALGKQRFLDIYTFDAGESDVVHVHNIIRLTLSADAMYLAPLSEDKVQKAIQEDGSILSAVRVDGGRRLVLTGSTAELQEFVLKHGDAIFSKARLYRRQQAATR